MEHRVYSIGVEGFGVTPDPRVGMEHLASTSATDNVFGKADVADSGILKICLQICIFCVVGFQMMFVRGRGSFRLTQ